MGGDETKVNEEVEGKGQTSMRSLIDPGEKKEPGEQEPGGKQTPKEEQPKDWEAECKKVQSEKDREVTEAKAEAGRLQRLTAPYAKNIKKTEGGEYVFDFSESAKPKERVAEPGKDLWLTDSEAATKQQLAFYDQQKEDADRARKEKQDAIDREDAFEKGWDESWERTTKLYPDMAKDSEHRKMADAILKENPALGGVVKCNEIVAEMAAKRLGIAPVEKGETTTSPEKKGKDTSYIVGGGPSSKGKGEQKEEPDAETPEEYIANRKKTLANKSLGVHT